MNLIQPSNITPLSPTFACGYGGQAASGEPATRSGTTVPDRVDGRYAAGRGASAAGAAPRPGKPLPAHTLPRPRRLRMRVDDICQAHRCAGGLQRYADHRVGSRREESLGAVSGCAVRRRAPQRAGRRVSPPCCGRRVPDLTTDGRWPYNPPQVLLPMPSAHGQPRPPAARVSFAATSDSRDTRRAKARPQRDCRVRLRDPTRVAEDNAEGALFHATSAGARTRCGRQVGAASQERSDKVVPGPSWYDAAASLNRNGPKCAPAS